MVEFASPQQVNRKVNNGDRVPFGDDGDLFVQFYKNPVTERDHIKMAFPGDSNTSYDQPVTQRDKVRYARLWEAYTSQTERFPGQTRIEEVAWLDEASQNHLRALNIFTIEQLSQLDDGNIHHVGMGARGWRDRARKHVEEKRRLDAAGSVDEEKAAMQRRLDEMQAQIEALTSDKAKGKQKA